MYYRHLDNVHISECKDNLTGRTFFMVELFDNLIKGRRLVKTEHDDFYNAAADFIGWLQYEPEENNAVLHHLLTGEDVDKVSKEDKEALIKEFGTGGRLWVEENGNVVIIEDLFAKAAAYYSEDPDIFNDYVLRHKDEYVYCYGNGKDLIDLDFWCDYQDLLGEKIPYDEYEAIDVALDGPPSEYFRDNMGGAKDEAVASLKKALDEYRINEYLSCLKDFEYLKGNMSFEGLAALGCVIAAYEKGQIDIEIIRDSEDQIDFDKSFGFVLNDSTYAPTGSTCEVEVVAMKWYEGFEDTGYMVSVLEDFVAKQEKRIDAILVERDYKGEYERFALTPEEFEAEFPDTYKHFGPIVESNSDTIRPLVHIWFSPCVVGDASWVDFFTDMEEGLPESDVEAGNLAYIREDLAQSLREYIVPFVEKAEQGLSSVASVLADASERSTEIGFNEAGKSDFEKE